MEKDNYTYTPYGVPVRVAHPINEVCEMTGLHKVTIIRLINKGEIPAKKVGRRWMIPRKWIMSLNKMPSATKSNQ